VSSPLKLKLESQSLLQEKLDNIHTHVQIRIVADLAAVAGPVPYMFKMRVMY